MTIGIDARSLEENQTGVGRYLLNLLENWACQTRHRIILYFKKEIPKIGILEKPCYVKKLLRPPFNINSNVLFQHFLLPKQALEDKTDILFSPSYILPLCYRGKTAVAIHDISFEVFPQNLSLIDRIFLKEAAKISARRASAIITISEFSKKEIIEHYRIPTEKIHPITLSADLKFLDAKKSKRMETIAKKFEISEKFILSVGTIFNRRHADILIGSFALVAKKFTDYQLLIVGKNATNPFIDIDRMIQETNRALGKKAILRRNFVPDDDLTALYAKAEALVYLSDYEGFGLPPLEAALAKTPVITSAIPAIKEIMGENTALFIKNNTDKNEIAGALETMITDQDQRLKLIDNAFLRAETYSWSACAKKTMEILEKI